MIENDGSEGEERNPGISYLVATFTMLNSRKWIALWRSWEDVSELQLCTKDLLVCEPSTDDDSSR